jgi:hypothetical protein
VPSRPHDSGSQANETMINIAQFRTFNAIAARSFSHSETGMIGAKGDLTILVPRRLPLPTRWRVTMRKISVALLAGTGVLFANGAMAADVFTNDATYLGMKQPSRA